MSHLKDKIIQSSLVLFSENGFHGVSVKDIVEYCDTSKGGFYHYFNSKDELLYVIHDLFISYVLNEANRAKKRQQRPMYQLHEILHSFVRVFDLYNEHISVFYQENKYLKAEYEEKIKSKRDQFKQIVIEVIEEGQKNGEIRKELPTIITGMSILGMVNWTYKWYKRDGDLSIDDIAEVYIDILFKGVLTDHAIEEYHQSTLHN
ncbi:TetR/AcrR family transcriptional regulator [Alkalibacillus haloalkaliphilus]|uniref:TetR/AcrR family transcriptional regulator n=1 Tax=Alkalibacillus haloalkaliphilus TaxID=94136 RepID=UPI002935F3B5|nr:TetR/AcrR family transcriptional regulator [Alkalibacillus haloalkaliphilus]MDV2580716.1 TetR/AcrR family transcriptional regulator [Alkalibacillus haloalkaliphilus]